MGDLYRTVDVHAIRNAKLGRGALVKALVDTGSSRTILSRRVARYLSARIAPSFWTVEGVARDVASVAVKVNAKSCGYVQLMAIVDDELASRAGRGADMLLGHDYMQNQRAIVYMDDAEKKQAMKCRGPIVPTKAPRAKRANGAKRRTA